MTPGRAAAASWALAFLAVVAPAAGALLTILRRLRAIAIGPSPSRLARLARAGAAIASARRWVGLPRAAATVATAALGAVVVLAAAAELLAMAGGPQLPVPAARERRRP